MWDSRNSVPKLQLILSQIGVQRGFFRIVDAYQIGFISNQFIGFAINLLGSRQLTAIRCATD